MTAAKPLRAVSVDETAPALTEGQSVDVAAMSGSHRALLVAMRDRIAGAVSNPNCPPRDLASLTKRLQDIANEIEAIDARDDDVPGRVRALESALREVAPEHELLMGMINDRFDASAI
ncbi:hypothetical protein CH274_13265 [Rhodococcus sp. 06-418-5]|uniref:hypothetical protein n=1 Tax=Rhodococcus sp. 06-418-5 TaxID=2022507 RepID=UPI000B9AC103|nr:hypothetical protein [Rhodococcus sp. 06-418-5]OZC80644.1 hypothetical protein CH274_13265 [Rhodococcus sp. 06-418-5]